MKLWQLVNPKTGEKLSEPQELPENWGPIFGLQGVKDRLGDLTWLGIDDQAWVEVEVADPVVVVDHKAIVDDQIAHFLRESLPMVAMDNPSLTKGQLQAWADYRKKLQEIPLQVGYPTDVYWPARPE
jgi:hypothetical protein